MIRKIEDARSLTQRASGFLIASVLSIICLATSALPSEAAIAIAALLPIASGLSFLLSERHYQAQRGSELFVDIPSTQKALPRMPHSVWLMTIALALVSSAFAWLSAVALFAPEQVISGPLVQSGCSLVATCSFSPFAR